jgi:TRAP-type C4-dicarboxylate transport system substrate-binding protein
MLRPSLTLACWIVLLVATGCGGGPADKAGGTDRPKVTVLEIASGDHGGRDIDVFMSRVSELSHGRLQIRERDRSFSGHADYERRIVQDVRSGRAAMGKVGARAWDAVGIEEFAPLVAPFVITSLEQQDRVLRSPLAAEMLASVQRLGLKGIALLPGELRYPVGITRDAVRPADFRGAVVGIRASSTAERTFAALGGRTRAFADDSSFDGLDVAEQDLETLSGAEGLPRVRSVAANLPLWPRTQTIVMNQAAYDRLTGEQKRILAAAARTAMAPSRDAIEQTAGHGRDVLCARAAVALRHATPADATAFRRAVAPVLAALRENARTGAALAAIDDMRTGTDTLSCTGRRQRKLPVEHVKTKLDGTWKANVTRGAYFAARPDAGEDDEANWGPLRMTLDRGRFMIENSRIPGDVTRGSYLVRGDRLLMAPEGTVQQGAGEIWRYRWSRYRDTFRLHRAARSEMPTALRAVPWVEAR